MVLDAIKHVRRDLLNGFKSIPGKACVKRVQTMLLWTFQISIRGKH